MVNVYKLLKKVLPADVFESLKSNHDADIDDFMLKGCILGTFPIISG